jgi:hypothetical protein
MKSFILCTLLLLFLPLSALNTDVDQTTKKQGIQEISQNHQSKVTLTSDVGNDPWEANMLSYPVTQDTFIFYYDEDVDWFKLPSLGYGDMVTISVQNIQGSSAAFLAYLYGPFDSPYDYIDLENSNWQLHYNPYYQVPESGDYYLRVSLNLCTGQPLIKSNDTETTQLNTPMTYTLSVEVNRNHTFNPPVNLLATNVESGVRLSWNPPPIVGSISGYRLYRDQVRIATLPLSTSVYIDNEDLVHGQVYEYYVVGTYSSPNGFSMPTDVTTITYMNINPPLWGDNFEQHPDFTANLPNWIQHDEDGENTNTIPGTDYDHAGEPLSFMVLNPSATTPPLENLLPQNGEKVLASFPPVNGEGDDWLVTPAIDVAADAVLSFYAKSYSANEGLAKFTINLSLGGSDPHDFEYCLLPNYGYEVVPNEWTHYCYSLHYINGYNARFAIQAMNSGDSILLLDDFRIISANSVDNQNQDISPQVSLLEQNYPNPFNPQTTISYNLTDPGQVSLNIFNIKGQKVKTLVNSYQSSGNHKVVWNGHNNIGSKVASGIYFYQITSDKTTSPLKKMILMK